MTNWFISVNGEQKGPYPTDQLRQLVSDGFVPRDAYVWREGMAQWQPLSQVRIADDGPAAPSPVASVQAQQYGQQVYSQQQSYGQQQPAYASDTYSPYVKPGYFSFQGRIGRKTFWLSYVVSLTVLILVAGIPFAFVFPHGDFESGNVNYMPAMAAGVVFFIVYIIVLIAMLSAYVKRLHDRGRSGWFVLLNFVPIANIWILIEVGFLKGTTGPNDYGADPIG